MYADKKKVLGIQMPLDVYTYIYNILGAWLDIQEIHCSECTLKVIHSLVFYS